MKFYNVVSKVNLRCKVLLALLLGLELLGIIVFFINENLLSAQINKLTAQSLAETLSQQTTDVYMAEAQMLMATTADGTTRGVMGLSFIILSLIFACNLFSLMVHNIWLNWHKLACVPLNFVCSLIHWQVFLANNGELISSVATTNAAGFYTGVIIVCLGLMVAVLAAAQVVCAMLLLVNDAFSIKKPK